jgi:exopolysaccharide production protein ExoY
MIPPKTHFELSDEAEARCLMLSHAILTSNPIQWRLQCKRLGDVVISSCLLVLLLPILILISLVIRMTSRGPIFFRQTRVGADGIEFQMLKFRTMKAESCADVPLLDAGNHLWKQKDDPRLTPVGRWLRRTSLDELPQLLNVLRGHMSLVGPRPLPRCMLQAPPSLLLAREVPKPGITGLWQIRDRRRNTSIWYMLPHDLEYAATLSLRRDAIILLRTLRVVVRCDGAV